MKKHYQIKNMSLDIYVVVYNIAISQIGVRQRALLVSKIWRPLDQNLELEVKYRTKELF
jgi:hypothetical protein